MQILPALVAFLGLAACSTSSSSSDEGPAGTLADPVEVCERVADVCRLDSSRLGVCVQAAEDRRPSRCSAGEACFVCTPQH